MQQPSNHFHGQGCPECAKENNKLSIEEVLKRFKKVHGDKYDYSRVRYIGNTVKVEIICPKHGEFLQTPFNHFRYGCPKCAIDNSYLSQEEVLKRFEKVHGDKYDYSKVEYCGNNKKVEIICPIHNSFFMKPLYIFEGSGCPKCASKGLTTNEIIDRFKLIHGDKYNYSLVDFKAHDIPIKIICSEHGEFLQKSSNHLQGTGCPKCTGKYFNTSEILKKFKVVHGSKYIYDLVEYTHHRKDVKILCPKHGEFLQKPMNHLRGHGCPKCSEELKISKGELKIETILKENNIYFETQKKFENCKNIHQLPFDFYLPDLNILIEYDGEQHFKAVEYFGGERTLLQTQQRDKIKTDFTKKENIKLIRISYWNYKNIEKILKWYLKL